MKAFFILLLCSSAVLFVSAQDATRYKDSTRFYEHSYLGFIYSRNEQFSGLNDRLILYYPKEIPEKLVGLSFGGKSVFRSFLVQGELGLAVGQNGSRNQGRTTGVHGYFSIDAGIMLLSTGTIRIYPFAGAGLDLASVTAKQSTNNIPFDSILANPVTRASIEPINLSTGFLTWRGGLAVDIGSKKNSHGPLLGIRAGYRQSFHSSKWRFKSENSFNNSPTDELKQWFGSIVFYGALGKMRDRSGR